MQKTLARAAASLFLLGLITGAYVSGAINGTLAADSQQILAAHLNGLMGCFLLLGLGWTLPFLRYGHAGQRRLCWAFIIAVYANWAITALKAGLHVRGLALNGNFANDAVFIALVALVVIPSLGASAAWVVGLYGNS